ncbi:MAG: hypothetical protein ACM3PC_02090 [Deltaproteobacteria bacterium]
MHDINRTQLEAPATPFQFNFEEGEFLPETEVQEFASQLLEVSSEEELDQFLGSLIKKAGSALGKVVRSPIGQAVGGVLKDVARQALPAAGAALGNMVVPGIGGAIGGQLASAAGSLFGLELEGLSNEEGEFEIAKQFVRLATDTAKTAIQAPEGDPAAVARSAIAQAAQKFAPGLVPHLGNGGIHGAAGGAGGRWVRRGGKIALYGV